MNQGKEEKTPTLFAAESSKTDDIKASEAPNLRQSMSGNSVMLIGKPPQTESHSTSHNEEKKNEP